MQWPLGSRTPRVRCAVNARRKSVISKNSCERVTQNDDKPAKRRAWMSLDRH
uniref:Uncharacterized protein n=1 Tax=Anguilla anguilla TaxID=7936 RepID=A0A0E9UJE6_ANGAN